MVDNINKQNFEYIINTYGKNPQIDMAIEECSELQKALLKERRGKGTVDDIIDEIADVQIMIEQLKIIFNCDDAVSDRIQYKINRQIKRILNND